MCVPHDVLFFTQLGDLLEAYAASFYSVNNLSYMGMHWPRGASWSNPVTWAHIDSGSLSGVVRRLSRGGARNRPTPELAFCTRFYEIISTAGARIRPCVNYPGNLGEWWDEDSGTKKAFFGIGITLPDIVIPGGRRHSHLVFENRVIDPKFCYRVAQSLLKYYEPDWYLRVREMEYASTA
jgi:hypothetical protein